jgi:hypothetical protein
MIWSAAARFASSCFSYSSRFALARAISLRRMTRASSALTPSQPSAASWMIGVSVSTRSTATPMSCIASFARSPAAEPVLVATGGVDEVFSPLMTAPSRRAPRAR